MAIGVIQIGAGRGLCQPAFWPSGCGGLRNRSGAPYAFSRIGSLSEIATGVIEDFEHGNILVYAGGTGYFSVVEAAAYQGSYGLRKQTESATLWEIWRLDILTGAGHRYTFWAKSNAQPELQGIFLGCSGAGLGANSGYIITHEHPLLRLRRDDNGSLYILDSVDVGSDWAVGTWYQFTIDWAANGNIDVSWSGGAQTLSANDLNYNRGYLGWVAGGYVGETGPDYDYCECAAL